MYYLYESSKRYSIEYESYAVIFYFNAKIHRLFCMQEFSGKKIHF